LKYCNKYNQKNKIKKLLLSLDNSLLRETIYRGVGISYSVLKNTQNILKKILYSFSYKRTDIDKNADIYKEKSLNDKTIEPFAKLNNEFRPKRFAHL